MKAERAGRCVGYLIRDGQQTLQRTFGQPVVSMVSAQEHVEWGGGCDCSGNSNVVMGVVLWFGPLVCG